MTKIICGYHGRRAKLCIWYDKKRVYIKAKNEHGMWGDEWQWSVNQIFNVDRYGLISATSNLYRTETHSIAMNLSAG